MPKFDFYPSFNAGEVSPFIDARTSLEKYRSACRTLENFQILPYGGVIRRPGTEFLGATKNANSQVRLIGFNYSTTTRFMIEMGVGYMRFWNPVTGTPITKNGTTVEVTTPYTASDLREIQYAQINDIMYFAHGNHAPRKLTRVSDDTWTFSLLQWDYPPTQDENYTDQTINVTQPGALRTWTAGVSYDLNEFVKPPGWTASTAYVVGDIVETGGVAYKCSVAHTSGATFSTANWADQATGIYFYKAKIAHTSGSNFGADVAAKKWSDLPIPRTGIGRFIISGPGIFKPEYSGQQMVLSWDLSYKATGSGAGTNTIGGTASEAVPITGNNVSDAIEIDGEWDLETNGLWNATIQVLRWDRQSTGRISATGTRSGTTVTVHHPNHGWNNGDTICVGPGYINGSSSLTDANYYTEAANITVTGSDYYTYTTADTRTGTLGIYPENLTKGEVVAEFTRNTATNGENNVLYSATQAGQATFRVRVINWVTGTSPASVRLSPKRTYSGGFATIIGPGSDGLSTGTSSQALINVTSYLGKNRHTLQANTTRWALPAFYSGNYPRTVALHEGRVCWGGTSLSPTTIWASEIDNFENFQIGVVASDSVKFNLSSSEGNRISWMYSQQNNILIGTTGDEWTLGAADSAQTLSATNVEAKRQSAYGSKYMRAVLINDVLLFVQRNGRKVRELVYELNKDGWVAPDLTLLAEHITSGEIVEVAYQQQPDAVLWCVRGDGTLIAMTYERDQKVVGWHRHIIADNASVESVATIYGNGTEDEVWMVVKRTVAGSDYRTIERFPLLWRKYLDEQTTNSWRYLDGWESFSSGTAGRTITGLSYLNGKTVTVVQEGQSPITRTVASGAITVPAATAGYLGLPYTSTLAPMKLDMDLEDGSSQGRKKRIHKIIARLYKSRGGEVRTNNGNWYALADTLSTGDQKMILAGAFGIDADVTLRQTAPYPMAVIAIEPVWNAYGNE